MGTREALRRIVAPVLGLIAVGLAAAALGYVSAGSTGGADAQPVTSAGSETASRGVVQSISGDSLTLATSSGPVTLRLSPTVRIEALRPATLARARQGDWLNAGAIPHNQTLFAIIGLVIIPAEDLQ